MLRNITIHYRRLEEKYLERPNKELKRDINKPILKAQLKRSRKCHPAVSHVALRAGQHNPEAQFERHESLPGLCTAHGPALNNP